MHGKVLNKGELTSKQSFAPSWKSQINSALLKILSADEKTGDSFFPPRAKKAKRDFKYF
jgi:hypothetical protein